MIDLQLDNSAIDALSEHASTELRAYLKTHHKPSVRFASNFTTVIKTGQSKFGGVPDVPEGFEWPTWDRGTAGSSYPLPFLMQIKLEPEFDVLDLGLPVDGHLLVFSDIDSLGEQDSHWDLFNPQTRNHHRLIHVPEGASVPAKAPENVQVFKEGLLVPYLTTSFEEKDFMEDDYDDFDVFQLNLGRFISEKLPDHLNTGGIHQLGGYPRSIQGPVEVEGLAISQGGYMKSKEYDWKQAKEDAKDWSLLLQIDSDDDFDFMWGDVGTLYWVGPYKQLSDGDYRQVVHTMQCT